jgi:streptogramin lyase
MGGAGGVNVYLLNGENGGTEKFVQIDTFPGAGFGAYGGAVDAAGNLYFSTLGPTRKLARVDIDNFVYQVWDVPADIAPYGITVDHKGRVWLSSNAIAQSGGGRFDPETETWEIVKGFWGGAGLAEGPGNLMWISSNEGVSAVDIDTLAKGPVFPTNELVKGVGFDSDGFLIGATYATDDGMGNLEGNDLLWKIDTDALMVVEAYNGLDRPYTYSDMTGYALGNVTCPPEG